MRCNLQIKTAIILFLLFTYHISQSQNEPEPKYEKTIQDAGDILQFAPAAASIMTLFVFKDKKGAWQFAKGFAVNLAATYVLKQTINKPRPDNASDGHAFPSGHTSVAFQGASFLQRRYGWKYGIPAYIIAGFVGYSRINGYTDRHDGWDVLAGAIVGIGSTYIFTTPYEKEHLELSFNSGNNSYLLGLKFKF